MPDSDIQEQIDIFMEKLEKSKVPKKASGEAIVSAGYLAFRHWYNDLLDSFSIVYCSLLNFNILMTSLA